MPFHQLDLNMCLPTLAIHAVLRVLVSYTWFLNSASISHTLNLFSISHGKHFSLLSTALSPGCFRHPGMFSLHPSFLYLSLLVCTISFPLTAIFLITVCRLSYLLTLLILFLFLTFNVLKPAHYCFFLYPISLLLSSLCHPPFSPFLILSFHVCVHVCSWLCSLENNSWYFLSFCT